MSEDEVELAKQAKRIEELNGEIIKKDMTIQKLTNENTTLQFEIKKAQLSINSPGRVVSSISSMIKNESNMAQLSKEKAELKETNQKLLLMLSEKEIEITSLKSLYEKKISQLNNEICSLTAKMNDLKSDIDDQQNQIDIKEKTIANIEENKDIIAKHNLLQVEYEQLKQNFEKQIEINSLSETKLTQLTNQIATLNASLSKIETEFNQLITNKTITCSSMEDLSCYTTLSENLRNTIMTLEDDKAKMESKYIAQIKKNRSDYKSLEDKYLESYQKITELENEISSHQNDFMSGTLELNKEMTAMKTTISTLNKQKDDLNRRINDMADSNDKLMSEFKNLQEMMMKMREKDDVDITLIEERYIVMENMLNMEKSDLITENRTLLNRLKLIEKNNNCVDLLLDDDNSYKHEIKILSEENKLLQRKMKEMENTMDGYEKIAEENRVNIEEIKSMKNSIIESNAHYDKVIDELNKKINTISTELVEARKRTSVLRSSQCYSSRDMNSVVRYANEIEELKNELEEEKKKHYNEMKKAEEDIAKIKTQLAEDTFKKDDEIIKLKNTNKKYYTILVDKGLIKK